MARLIRQLARQHGIPVVDGRRWLPADQFWDFYHVFPDFGVFPERLAQEILRVRS